MLSSNIYVRVISPDFSKAFDTVRHAPLFDKLSMLDIPDEVYNWMDARARLLSRTFTLHEFRQSCVSIS